MEQFSISIRKRAKELGLSNAEVARRAGLTERRYGNYVTGRREPDLATFLRIAEALGSTPDQLLVPNDVAAVAASREQLLADLNQEMAGLAVEHLAVFMDLARALRQRQSRGGG